MNKWIWMEFFFHWQGEGGVYSSLLKCFPKEKDFSLFNLALNRHHQVGEKSKKIKKGESNK